MSEENVAKEYFEKYIKDFEKRIGKNLTTEFNEHLKVLLSRAEKQQKEIEEKTTIIMVGAEKVKQLEKEIEELKKDRKDHIQVVYGGRRFGTEGMVVKDYISKDKIKEKLNQINNEYSILLSNKSLSLEQQNMNAQRHEAMRVALEELLEENDE